MALEKLLGTQIPLIQAPMAGVQDWRLAVAVAKAGGLGSIPCAMLSPEQIKAALEQFRSHCDQPYNLNFFCHTMPEVDQSRLAQWQDVLAPYYSELGCQPPEGTGALRRPFDATTADVLETFKPPVLSFHFGLPSPELVERIKSWGSVILSSATTVAEGLWLQAHGADAVIAQGLEAGGHRAMFLDLDASSQVATLPLVSQLTEQLRVPVIAAGGVASHKDVQAMLQLGAAGVQVGTSYLLCDEATTGAVHRQAIKTSQADTALTNAFSGRLARGIRNRLMNDLGLISEQAPAFPYAAIALGPLRQRAEARQSSDFTPLWSGQNRSGCREISATELTRELWFGE